MAQIDPKARMVFLAFNILYFMLGAGMLGVGIYNITAIRSYEEFAQGVYITGGVLFIIVGIAKIILSIMGIVGWGTEFKILLTLYGLLAIFFILPTLAAGIFGLQQWYYVFDDVGREYSTIFNTTSLYESTDELRDRIRDDLHCCGVRAGIDDYTRSGRTPETEDCNAAKFYRGNDTALPDDIGCQYYVTSEIRFHLYYIGAIGLGFGFFELLAAIVAMQNMEGLL